MNHMIPVTEEILAHKQLDRSVLGSGDHDDGEPGSGISSDFNDPAVDDMILEGLKAKIISTARMPMGCNNNMKRGKAMAEVSKENISRVVEAYKQRQISNDFKIK
ncbi:hypothetical protein FF1_040974 [Malus domestica]